MTNTPMNTSLPVIQRLRYDVIKTSGKNISIMHMKFTTSLHLCLLWAWHVQN